MTSGGLVVGLDHVAITAPEELESEVVDWYERVLGLPRITKPDGTRIKGAWFSAGDVEVHVTIDEHNPPKIAHYALVVTDPQAAIDRLRDAGCHIEQASSIPGRKRFYTRDPAGNRIEIVAFEGER
ncbi:MAG: VOC family protein [Actinomycetota bacterium]